MHACKDVKRDLRKATELEFEAHADSTGLLTSVVEVGAGLQAKFALGKWCLKNRANGLAMLVVKGRPESAFVGW
jgi:hypothetical protein